MTFDQIETAVRAAVPPALGLVLSDSISQTIKAPGLIIRWSENPWGWRYEDAIHFDPETMMWDGAECGHIQDGEHLFELTSALSQRCRRLA